MNYVPIVVATDLEVHFSVLKKGCQYFCLYSVYLQILEFRCVYLTSKMTYFVLFSENIIQILLVFASNK